ncbi:MULTISPECIES: hypothetical protein [Bradyrhizobium]|jgi:hypothetical protein|uniref:Uncharacterized protein n=1 Tax=Bradyrhizobium canariense TaxID=255045 RepID=A0A1X3FZ07_9BRAD|nr:MULTISPECIES: hypothetical protein [Bradyrhizobium]OSI71781.1 hypothetical protein BSZ22_10580 [Bradyrhizobium canariense]OSI78525.1 hypothetical protein BSZ23_18085 [Bradyrhizobium canariense]OSI90549.1 hypothetical protein BSZ25_17720 [Bradyrhizobium canariense]OSI92951.1 hypothetical protein BSZ24_14215 [Bradyrhizobium canariense]OSJ04901.1 hypothetical protein BSZ16_13140 [Bradyrhizobium canariense]
MLKYIAKISMDIFPSVLATIIGAYIVNHYINAKPAADAPAAVTAPAEAGKNGKPADVANLPAPGVKAKGISEKNVTDKPAAEKAADHPGAESKTSTADVAPAEAAPRGKPSGREKAVAKSTPAVSAAAPATPVVEANSAPAAAAPAAAPDANDLVRAAIERLRKSPESKAAEAKASDTKPSDSKASDNKSSEIKAPEKTQEPAVREAARTPEAPRIIPVDTSSVRPLPPPITVSTPAAEAYGNGGSLQPSPPYTASIGNENPNRLTPPADIPVPMIAPPLDLRADAGASMPRPKTNVADDMLSGVKSMFHSVLPKSVTPD